MHYETQDGVAEAVNGISPKMVKDAETDKWVRVPDVAELWVTAYKKLENL